MAAPIEEFSLRVEPQSSVVSAQHWSFERRLLRSEGSANLKKSASFTVFGRGTNVFADAVAAARNLLQRSVTLYTEGRDSDALDYTLHTVLQSVEIRDTLFLSGVLIAINERIDELAASSRQRLPREVDLWLGVLLVTRGLAGEPLPIRAGVMSSAREFVEARLEKAKAKRLLRGLT